MKISIPWRGGCVCVRACVCMCKKQLTKKYIEMMEKDFSEVRNSDCSKILLYSSYCFSAPLGSKSVITGFAFKLLGHEVLLSPLGQPQLQGSSL